jgi:hypothetical protein
MEGSQMTYVLVLTVLLDGAPMLIPRMNEGAIVDYASSALCEQELLTLKAQLAPRVNAPHNFVCVTRKVWDATPDEFSEFPPAFRIAPKVGA